MNNSSCPYCFSAVNIDDSSKIYGKSYGLVYICSKFPECDSYVGVHKGTTNPLGRLANKELRYWKKLAHSIFDIKWKYKKNSKKQRTKSYNWLSEKLNIPIQECHIGMFDIEMCKKVVSVCKEFYKGQ